MSDSDPDLHLNCLARFSKNSRILALDVNNHCEIPAGCGGVVLRWFRPAEPVPMVFRIVSENGWLESLAIDGEVMGSLAKLPVPCGHHALTLTLRNVDPRYACLLLAGIADKAHVKALGIEGDTALLSLPDGTWRYTLEPPPDDSWKMPGFDGAWSPMAEKPIAADAPSASGTDWMARKLTSQGAKSLGIDVDAKDLGIDVSRPLASKLRGWLSPRARRPLVPVVYVRIEFHLRKGGDT